MRINEHRTGEIAIVALAGRVRGWEAATALDDCFRRQARSNDVRTVIVDLSEVRSVDSVGLDALIRGRQLLRYADADMHIAGLTDRLDDLVVITRLATLCNAFGTTSDAIARVSPAMVTSLDVARAFRSALETN
jgi:anti-sigma B factor antagonist